MSRQFSTREFTSMDGEHRIITTLWEPDGDPIGVVQIVHGMLEHMGRYDHFAQVLCDNGFVVWGHDHIGHGLSAQAYGTFGYFGETGGARTLVDDTTTLTEYLATTYPDLPIFLLGHSMGSMISRLSVLQTAPLLSGFICMGTTGGSPALPYARAVVEGIKKVKGKENHSHITSKGMRILTSSFLNKEEIPSAWVSHDEQMITTFAQDPLTQFQFTVQGYSDLLDLMIACNRPQWYDRYSPSLPIFLVSGEEDPISRGGKDLPLIANKLEEAFVLDVEYKIYPHMRHEILNEVHKEQVYQDLLIWMQTRI